MSKFFRFTLLLLCLTPLGCGKKPVTATPPPPVNKDWAITLTWGYDFTNMIQCSSTVKSGCVSGFTVGYIDVTSGKAIALPNPVVPLTACAGATQPVKCQYTGNAQLPIGQITWTAAATGFDNTGGAITASTNSAVPASIQMASPTNVVGTTQ